MRCVDVMKRASKLLSSQELMLFKGKKNKSFCNVR